VDQFKVKAQLRRKDSKTLHYEGKTLRLSTLKERLQDCSLLIASPALDSSSKERTTIVDHFKVKGLLRRKDSKTLHFEGKTLRLSTLNERI
jgi:hypothetical protein